MVKNGDRDKAKEIGLYLTDNHLLFRWTDGEKEVFFSAAQQGKAMTIHIAAEGRNKTKLRESVAEFVPFLFDKFKWCDVVIGAISKRSVINLAYKCGFTHIGDALIGEDEEQGKLMARFR